MRVVRRHPIGDERIRFSFVRFYPASISPGPHEAAPGDALYDLLMLDVPLFDGREDGRWGNGIWRARLDDGIWIVED